MKKLITTALATLVAVYAHSQNTFPASGNVGIGNTNPGSLLSIGSSSVRGTLNINGSTGDVPAFSITDSRGSGSQYTFYNGLSGSGKLDIFDQNAQAYRFTINPAGNVGIGTTSPSYKLDVNGTGNFSGSLTGTSATFSNVITQTVGGDAIVWSKNGTVNAYLVANTTGVLQGLVGTASNHPFSIRTNNTEKYTIDENGNHDFKSGTAIFRGALTGTTATFNTVVPTAFPLTVGSNSSANAIAILGRSSDNIGVIQFRPNNSNDLQFDVTSSPSQTTLRTFGVNNMVFQTNNATALSINSSQNAAFVGSVNIGTAQTSANLYVCGTVKSKEVKVESTITVPDYVFEKSYELKPLAEIDKYVSENKHLPEIPSAKEIEKEGINLGEMQMKLLQKIEELTLHLIDQNKQLEQQNTRLESQEAENTDLKKRLFDVEQKLTKEK